MDTKVRNGTKGYGKDINRDLIEVLIAISVVSKRIAEKLYAEGDGTKTIEKGGEHGQRRVIYTQRRTQEMW